MDENGMNNHMVLPENFLVQPVGNIPVSMIDYGKLQVAQFIHPGQFYNRVPVIQFADVNSNPPMRQLHPLELEIQRDFQARQQQQQGLSFSNQPPNSLLHASTQTIEGESGVDSAKPLGVANVIFDGSFIPLQTVPNIGEGIVNMDASKVQDNMFYQPVMKQVMVDKGPYFVVPQTQVVFNNVLDGNQNNDVPETDAQVNGPEEGVPEADSVPSSDVGECGYSLETGETVLHVQLNQHGSNTKGGGEEEAKEAALDPDLKVVDNNTNKPACLPTEFNKHDTNLKEPAESDSETDENYAPNSDYESNVDDPPTPKNGGKKRNCKGSEKPHTCHMCNKRFGLRKNMYFHIRKVHNIQPVIEGGISCPICKESTTKHEYLRSHLESLHGILIEKEERLFNTLNDFLSWKKQVQKETLSSYISKSSTKLLANNEQKTYYQCHRSGNYVSVQVRRKRLNGSNKMGATCPAGMEVTENKTGISVIFWKTHVGHYLEISRLPLTKDDRAKILDHLNWGSPLDEIVRHFQSESSMNPPSKLSVLTKQDVRNVKKVYELENNPELKKIPEGPKAIQEKILKTPSPESIIEKADILWELLETTDVKAEFRSKVCLMLDNLISLVKRRGEKVVRRKSMSERRKDWLKRNRPDITDQIDYQNKMKSQKILQCQRN